MDISLFTDLERLNQTGNFTRAAELANITQPAFSRRIKALEAWVGTKLVDRSRQPVTLTAAGSQMLEAGLQSLAHIEQVRSQVLTAQSSPEKYVVAFGKQHSISWLFYTNWLRAVEEAYGPILSRLRADDLPHCMTELQNGHLDFVIAYARAGELSDDGQSIVIGKDRLVPVCKPDADGRPMYNFNNRDGQIPFLRFGDESSISEHLEPLFRENNLQARLLSVYENPIAGSLLIRVREGSGVAWLPESLIEADITTSTLLRTGDDAWTVELDIRLYRNEQESNNLTRSIWSFMESEMLPLL